MKKHTKGKIWGLLNLEEENGREKSIQRLKKRYAYLESMLGPLDEASNQMKYISFHLKRLEVS